MGKLKIRVGLCVDREGVGRKESWLGDKGRGLVGGKTEKGVKGEMGEGYRRTGRAYRGHTAG